MVNEIISAIDILPTLAYLAGKAMIPQAEIEGVNIWKAVSDGTPLGERTLYWRTREQFALRKGDWKQVYTGILYEGNYELFNLTKDPNEKQDVAKDNHEIVNAMSEELKIQAELDIIL